MWRLLAAGTVTVGICIIHRTSEDLLIGPLGRSQRAAMKERGGHNYQWRHNNAGIEIIPFMPAWGVSDSLTFFIWREEKPQNIILKVSYYAEFTFPQFLFAG